MDRFIQENIYPNFKAQVEGGIYKISKYALMTVDVEGNDKYVPMVHEYTIELLDQDPAYAMMPKLLVFLDVEGDLCYYNHEYRRTSKRELHQDNSLDAQDRDAMFEIFMRAKDFYNAKCAAMIAEGIHFDEEEEDLLFIVDL